MSLRLRKFSPIDRKYPIYEVWDDEQLLIDVSRSEQGNFELTLCEQAQGRIVALDEMLKLITEAKGYLLNEGDD